MPIVTFLRLSDVSDICRVTVFSFQFSLLFFHRGRQAAQRRTWFTQYRTSDVAENVGSTFLVRRVQPMGNDWESILTVKWKLDIP